MAGRPWEMWLCPGYTEGAPIGGMATLPDKVKVGFQMLVSARFIRGAWKNAANLVRWA